MYSDRDIHQKITHTHIYTDLEYIERALHGAMRLRLKLRLHEEQALTEQGREESVLGRENSLCKSVAGKSMACSRSWRSMWLKHKKREEGGWWQDEARDPEVSQMKQALIDDVKNFGLYPKSRVERLDLHLKGSL